MVTVDRDRASAGLLPLLKRHMIPAELGKLKFGDVSFIGRGAEGRPVPVGVEYKKLPEMLKSYLDKRYVGHQYPGMARTYERSFLLVEGEYRPDPKSGLLQVQKFGHWISARNAVMWREYRAHLMTLAFCGGVPTLESKDESETGWLLACLYRWWTGKDFDQHKSHLAFSEAGPEGLLTKHSLKRRWAKELPGIGYEKSKALADHYESARHLALATVTDLMEVDGIGHKLAIRIAEEIGRR